MRHEKAAYAIFNHVRRAAVRAANDGFGIRHGLQEYQAESFGAAGQCEHIAVGIAGEEFLLREAENKMNTIRDARVTRKLFEFRSIVTITNKNQRCVWNCLQNARQCGNERVRAFVAFGRVPSTNRENDAGALWERCGTGWRDGRTKSGLEFRVETPGELPHFVGTNFLVGNQMLGGVAAGREDPV